MTVRHEGRLWQPDHPAQEILANGAACGDQLRRIGKMWEKEPVQGYDPFLLRYQNPTPWKNPLRKNPVGGIIIYPVDYFGAEGWGRDEEVKPVKTPITEATMHVGAEDLPILAWIVSPSGGSAAVVVDMLERPRSRPRYYQDEPVTYTDCKLIQGTPSEVLPREIRERMGLS